MSKAENANIMSRLTRRTALAGLSAAAAAGVAALPAGGAAAPIEPDPIFAVIAEHRAAVEALVRSLHLSGRLLGPEFDAAQVLTDEASTHADGYLRQVLTVQPTTLVGAVALLAHVGLPEFLDRSEFKGEDETILSAPIHGDDECPFKIAAKDFPTRLAETMRGLIGQSWVSPARVAQQPVADPIYAAIERSRLAWAELEAHCSALSDAGTPEAHAEELRLNHRVSAADEKMVETDPTTIAGAVALLRYVADHERSGKTLGDMLNADALANALAKIAAERGLS
jgi:hypothetical protein